MDVTVLRDVLQDILHKLEIIEMKLDDSRQGCIMLSTFRNNKLEDYKRKYEREYGVTEASKPYEDGGFDEIDGQPCETKH
jgi:hypothetical protein